MIAIEREGKPLSPSPDETLRPGDTLVPTGTAVDAARALLTASSAPPPSS